jgi:hypothetical protein
MARGMAEAAALFTRIRQLADSKEVGYAHDQMAYKVVPGVCGRYCLQLCHDGWRWNA